MTESNRKLPKLPKVTKSYESYPKWLKVTKVTKVTQNNRNHADQESDWSKVVLIKSLEKFAEQQNFFLSIKIYLFFFWSEIPVSVWCSEPNGRVRNGRVPKYPKVPERYPSNPKYTRFRARISNTLCLRWTFFGSIMTRLFIPRTSVFVRVFQTLFVVSVVTLFWQLFFVFFGSEPFLFHFFHFFLLARVIPRV